jgi:Ubiquitin family
MFNYKLLFGFVFLFTTLNSGSCFAYTIIVKTLSGRTFKIEVEANESFLDVKQKIAKQEEYPVEWIRLIINGKKLNDDDIVDIDKLGKETLPLFWLILSERS